MVKTMKNVSPESMRLLQLRSFLTVLQTVDLLCAFQLARKLMVRDTLKTEGLLQTVVHTSSLISSLRHVVLNRCLSKWNLVIVRNSEEDDEMFSEKLHFV
mmetsp:Transcript_16428/g.19730  ORF Transcript_16428/g.19730 Transcript_16428/m.19730 type:complete len:100 (+) Transcript_16428:894-1193(+)